MKKTTGKWDKASAAVYTAGRVVGGVLLFPGNVASGAARIVKKVYKEELERR